VLGLIVLLAYTALAATVLPAWIVSVNAGARATDDHRLDAIASTRGALLGVLAPVVVAIGALAALLNYRETSAQNRRTVELSRDTLDVTRRGQLTERFTKAIEQLGQTDENKLDIRLGGIYALEQVAKESVELYQPVMEILTAFLREHCREPEGASAMHEAHLRADFQAIATVLGRREVSHDPDVFRLDLHGVALVAVDFTSAQLQKASFDGAQLQEANFDGAQLQKAGFVGAQLREAHFIGAQLQGAYFIGAQLQATYFADAQLQEAYFRNADLQGAQFALPIDMGGSDAKGLTWEQLAVARNVDQAVLPDYVMRAPKSPPPGGPAV